MRRGDDHALVSALLQVVVELDQLVAQTGEGCPNSSAIPRHLGLSPSFNRGTGGGIPMEGMMINGLNGVAIFSNVDIPDQARAFSFKRSANRFMTSFCE